MRDIGIDLGTANVLIYVKGEGIVLNEPSVIAIDTESKKVLAVGNEANIMLGRTPGKVKIIKPLKDGVIADFDYTISMLEEFMKKVRGKGKLKKPNILICCPAEITPVEKNALREAAENLGAKKVIIEEEPKVAAIGAGLDIERASGNMVIDIGGGTTDIAILSLGSIVASRSIKVAGNTFDQAIIDYVKDKYDLLIGSKTAEEIKIDLGCVYKPDKENKKEIKGRSLTKGMPKTINISEKEVYEAIIPQVNKLVKEIKKVLESSLPELASDISDNGITLTGGGALLKGIQEFLESEIKININKADSPLTCVADGCGVLISDKNFKNKEQ